MSAADRSPQAGEGVKRHSQRTRNITGSVSSARRGVTRAAAYGGNGPPAPPPPSDGPDATAKLIENERWKYLGTLLNTVAAAAIAVGIITPTSAILAKGPGAITEVDAFVYGGFCLIWLGVAAALHLSVQYVLGNLRS